MKILITTGGSGGHIFPAIEVAKVLRHRGHTVVFAGVIGMAEEKIRNLNFETYPLSAKGFTDRSFWGTMSFMWIMFQAILRAFGILRRIAPERVIGFGGYGSFPVVFASGLMRYPTMIHEQNVLPGKANAFMSGMVQRVAISFQASRKYFKVSKTVWTGCPCHHRGEVVRSQALKSFELQEGKKTVLLMGGSQGSQKLNEVFSKVMQDISMKSNIQAIHMTGKKDHALYRDMYARMGLPVKALDFIVNIEEAYALADLVIARAGAATVTELGLLAIPSILVPYPFAGQHQKYNAEVLSQVGAAGLIEQADLTTENLRIAIENIFLQNLSKADIYQKTQGLFQEDSSLQLALAVEGLK